MEKGVYGILKLMTCLINCHLEFKRLLKIGICITLLNEFVNKFIWFIYKPYFHTIKLDQYIFMVIIYLIHFYNLILNY